MPNIVKYNNVNWDEQSPVAGERLSTNGYYTGEHKGTPMQDAKCDTEANAPHYVEANVVRLGTMMQDAVDKYQPTKASE